MILTFNFLSLMFFFVLGAIIGSFLNVVIFRYKTGRSINGRSACLSCVKKLQWYELVPVLSYVILRGKCRSCRTPISIQYMLVEFITGALFAGIAYRFFDLLVVGDTLSFFMLFGFYAVIVCLAVVIAVYDMRHMIIPNPFVYAWIALGLIPQVLTVAALGVTQTSLLSILTGPILFTFFWALWYFSKGTWMGFGDAKLALAIGLTLAFSRGIAAIIIGFWIGAIFGIVLIALSKSKYLREKVGLKSEIPFGPFLIIGFFLAFFWNLDLVWMASLFAF